MCKAIKRILNYITRNKVNAIITAFLLVALLLSFFLDFRNFVESRDFLMLLKKNTLYVISVITRSIPLIAFLLLIYIWRKIATKLVIRVEKLDVGGLSIIFERPEELFKQQVKNFLNTKRALLSFDPQRDNISDCLDSFYSIYEFIRVNMSVYDTKSSQQSDYYDTANKMLRTLNEFLTSHQSDYRRWFKAIIEGKYKNDTSVGIAEIQREYRNYERLIADFANLNNSFQEYAKKFDVDINKWVV